MYKYLLLFFLSVSFLFSSQIKDIIELEKGLAKDFVIYQYLKNNSPSSDEAKILYKQISRMTHRLEILFNKFIKDEKFNFKINCQMLKENELLSAEKKCAYLSLSPKKVENLSLKKQKILYEKLNKLYKNETSWLKSMMKKNTFKSLIKGDGKDFLKVFISVSKGYKYKNLDKKLPLGFLSKMANKEDFEKFVLEVVMDEKYKNIPISLLKTNPKRKILTYDSAFYLGILSLKYKKEKLAYDFFIRAFDESEDRDLKDKALFWQYQVKKEKSYLEKLSLSKRLNFYSLYAKEKLKNVDFEIISPKPEIENLSYYSITDPYSWEYTKRHIEGMEKKKLEEFAKSFFTKATLPYYVFMMQRVNGYDKIYFIAPYQKYIEKLSPKRKTLIYAIARQESRCIPVDVSKSYALGMMQFMPFLAKAIAKDEGIKHFRYFDMFHPKIALNFANTHLNYLQAYLFNPLFIAYAYNGGIGFTRRMLQNTKLFKKGKYEPFLSMELVPYPESREYGKKVITNYVIYGKMFGLDVNLDSLLKDLGSTKIQ